MWTLLPQLEGPDACSVSPAQTSYEDVLATTVINKVSRHLALLQAAVSCLLALHVVSGETISPGFAVK